MAKLTIWQDQQLKQKIEQCIHGYRPKYRKDSILIFPLEDILFDFYKGAVYSTDFYRIESLQMLYSEYCDETGGLNLSLDEMIEQGYISVYMERWSTTLLNSSIYELEKLEDYPQGDVLRFLLWLNEHPDGKKSCMEIVDLEKVLGKWRELCANVPEVDWFVKKTYLEQINGKYYAVNGYGWDRNIDRALAKLWEYWGEEQFESWLLCARCVKGTSSIFEYLGTESGRSLLKAIVEKVLNKCEVPTLEKRNRCYEMTRILSSLSYAKKPEEYKGIDLWTGNRVFDIYTYERYGFEAERWYGTHAEDFQLIIYSVMNHLDLLKTEEIENLAEKLKQYDWLGATHECYGISSDSLYELLSEGDTFFLGFRYLVRAEYRNRSGSYGQVENVCAVLQELISNGEECQGYLRGEEIGSSLLYLFHEHKMAGKNGENPYYLLVLKGFLKELGTKIRLEEVTKELLEYASSLLLIKNSVDWCTGFHLLLFCAEEWFFKNEKLQTIELFEHWMELIWRGYQMIFSDKTDYATFVNGEYFTENICAEIFKRYIEPQKLVVQTNRLIQIASKEEADKQRGLRYRYRLLLDILFKMYTGVEPAPTVVKMCMSDVLKESLLGEEKIFEYAYVQIFSSEEVLNACLGLLSSKEKEDCDLVDELIKQPIPDLLIYYHAVKDEVLKEQIHKEISSQATEDSLDVFHGARAIELVLEYKLEALYPAAQKELNHWLETWKKRGVPEHADYVEHARNLCWWLKYNKREYAEVLAGDNPFYQAIIYMDVEEYLDLKHAGVIWQEMIESPGRKKYGAGVYLNYMLVLARRMEHWNALDAAECEEVNEKLQWIMEQIEAEEISGWNLKRKKDYCKIVIECKKLRGEEFLHEIYNYNQKYDISFTLEQFLTERDGTVETDETAVQPNEQVISEKIVDALCRFYAMSLEKKGKAYYKSRSFEKVQEAQQMLVVESVLRTCDALQRCGAQLVQKKDEKIVLGEDLVTQLFRELYNIANSNWFNLKADDQRQMGSTGNWRGERKSPAELDITICFGEQIVSVAEAFVLKEDTKYGIFKDHVGKIIGNNVTYAPLGIMLLYGNALDNDKAWERYCEYLKGRLKIDIKVLEDKNVPISIEDAVLENAPYYAPDVFGQYHGFRFIRQVINIGKDKVELLHIFVDVAKNAHGEIRRSL